MNKIISINNLTYIYDKRNTGGINKLNLDIFESEVLSILGPSGSGKSTLLNCLNKSISVSPENLSHLQELVISTVSQDNSLSLDKNVFENIAAPLLGSSLDEEKLTNQVRTTLSYLELTNEIEKFPNELSSGQKQRVIIGQALVTNPNLLLFDEAFGHLDEKLRKELYEELLPIFKEKQITLINVTHNNEEALIYSDRIMLLNYGQLQQIGTPTQIFNYPNNLFTGEFFSNSSAFISNFEKNENNLSFKLFNKVFSVMYPNFLEIAQHKQGLVIASQEAITINKDGEFKGVILNKYFKGYYSLYYIQAYDQHFFSLSLSSLANVSDKIQFSIDTKQLRFIGEV